jgi:hypothetical protein
VIAPKYSEYGSENTVIAFATGLAIQLTALLFVNDYGNSIITLGSNRNTLVFLW